MKRIHILLIVLILTITAYLMRQHIYDLHSAFLRRRADVKSLEKTEEWLIGTFDSEKIPYPPQNIIAVGIKNDHLFELWAQDKNGNYQLVLTSPKFLVGRRTKYDCVYPPSEGSNPILPGPETLPEGVFNVRSYSPYEHFLFLSNLPDEQIEQLKDRFPNERIRKYAVNDLMIDQSDINVPYWFIDALVYRIGADNIIYIISPVDFRKEVSQENIDSHPEWSTERYKAINKELSKLNKS